MSLLRNAWAFARLTVQTGSAVAGVLWTRRRAVAHFRRTLRRMGLPAAVAEQLAAEYAAALPSLRTLVRRSHGA